jgi:hypothetical protein
MADADADADAIAIAIAMRSKPIKAERSDGPNQHAEPKRLALLAYAKARRTAQPERLSKIGVVFRPFALVGGFKGQVQHPD